MSRWTSRRQAFRKVLEGSACVYPASVHDPVSARIAEDIGFELGMFAGSVASLAVLGAPDLIVLTLSEFAGQALRISRASELPLMVDADHGYGNALNAMRTVEELEIAGVAGLSIEDTELPQPYGAGGAASMLSVEAGAAKLRAAVAARRDPALAIAGRTSAAAIAGVEEAARRVRVYATTGVDAIFLVGVKRREDLLRIVDGLTLPVILGGVPPSMADRDWLAQAGVRICLQGHQPFAAAAQAIHDTLKALRDGADPASLPRVATGEFMRRVSRADVYDAATREYLD
ncbi:MAG: oxaloacetate decarboxylase [Lautropia sp.]